MKWDGVGGTGVRQVVISLEQVQAAPLPAPIFQSTHHHTQTHAKHRTEVSCTGDCECKERTRSQGWHSRLPHTRLLHSRRPVRHCPCCHTHHQPHKTSQHRRRPHPHYRCPSTSCLGQSLLTPPGTRHCPPGGRGSPRLRTKGRARPPRRTWGRAWSPPMPRRCCRPRGPGCPGRPRSWGWRHPGHCWRCRREGTAWQLGGTFHTGRPQPWVGRGLPRPGPSRAACAVQK